MHLILYRCGWIQSCGLNAFKIYPCTYLHRYTHLSLYFRTHIYIYITAQTEMEMYTTLFNKLTTTCFSKCVSRKHKQDDLALGETSCIDRCVAKYMASQQKIGTVLQKANEAQMEQARRMQQMQQAFGG